MAAHETATKGLPRRAECSWMERATTSLPVPDSPVISTVVSKPATCSIILRTRRTAGEAPVGPVRRVLRGSSCSMRSRLARRISSESWTWSTGVSSDRQALRSRL